MAESPPSLSPPPAPPGALWAPAVGAVLGTALAEAALSLWGNIEAPVLGAAILVAASGAGCVLMQFFATRVLTWARRCASGT